MLTKLLLTVTVIAIVLLFARTRRSPGISSNKGQKPPPDKRPRPSPARLTAWILIAVIVTVTLILSSIQWLSTPAVVLVHVINSSNGNSVSYHAYADRVTARSFETIDGRTIILAEVERAEISK